MVSLTKGKNNKVEKNIHSKTQLNFIFTCRQVLLHFVSSALSFLQHLNAKMVEQQNKTCIKNHTRCVKKKKQK